MMSKVDRLLLEMEPVARDNNTSWTLKPGRQTFVVPYSTDNCSTTLNGISFISYPCSGKEPSGGGGVLLEELGGGVQPASQNPYPIYDQNLRFYLSYLWAWPKFDTIVITVVADTVASNIIYEGFCGWSYR